MYSDPRLARRHGGVLFVGPSHAYLAYVADVLPGLGEDGVQLATLRDLVSEGADAVVERDPRVVALKSSARMVEAIEAAVRYHERPPANELLVETEWGDLVLGADDWADAFDAAEPGTSHNAARDGIWEELLEILGSRVEDEAPTPHRAPFVAAQRGTRRSLRASLAGARSGRSRGRPVVVARISGDCAPWLEPEDLRALHREDARAWTVSDLPLLDAARHRIGDPESLRRGRRRAVEAGAQREEMSRSSTISSSLRNSTTARACSGCCDRKSCRTFSWTRPRCSNADPDLLAGPFAHILVDEAQELTDAEWQMLLQRCPSRSFTIVGDRAQARHGFTESWEERLERIGLAETTIASLTVNYRTPAEVMAEAEPVIRAAIPDANVPISIRASGNAVVHDAIEKLDTILDGWLADHDDGVAAVIGDALVCTELRASAS